MSDHSPGESPQAIPPTELRELTQRMVRLCDSTERKPLNPLRASRQALARESAREAIRELLLPVAKKIDAKVEELESRESSASLGGLDELRKRVAASEADYRQRAKQTDFEESYANNETANAYEDVLFQIDDLLESQRSPEGIDATTLRETFSRWCRQGRTDDYETPIDDYGKRILSMVIRELPQSLGEVPAKPCEACNGSMLGCVKCRPAASPTPTDTEAVREFLNFVHSVHTPKPESQPEYAKLFDAAFVATFGIPSGIFEAASSETTPPDPDAVVDSMSAQCPNCGFSDYTTSFLRAAGLDAAVQELVDAGLATTDSPPGSPTPIARFCEQCGANLQRIGHYASCLIARAQLNPASLPVPTREKMEADIRARIGNLAEAFFTQPYLKCDHCSRVEPLDGNAQLGEVCDVCNVGAFRFQAPEAVPTPPTMTDRCGECGHLITNRRRRFATTCNRCGDKALTVIVRTAIVENNSEGPTPVPPTPETP